MQKETLGFIILMIAGLNVYWKALIHFLMKFKGSDAEMTARHKQAAQLSLLSKVSYGVVLAAVAAFWFIQRM